MDLLGHDESGWAGVPEPAAVNTATAIPASWAAMKGNTPAGAMPAKVSESDRAMVTAGLANDVEAVNQ